MTLDCAGVVLSFVLVASWTAVMRARCVVGKSLLLGRPLGLSYSATCVSFNHFCYARRESEGKRTGSLLLAHNVGGGLLGALHLGAAHVVALFLYSLAPIGQRLGSRPAWRLIARQGEGAYLGRLLLEVGLTGLFALVTAGHGVGAGGGSRVAGKKSCGVFGGWIGDRCLGLGSRLGRFPREENEGVG